MESTPLFAGARSNLAAVTTDQAWSYDVFLSFRGEDTRRGFTDNLYHALRTREIRTYIDAELSRGDEISSALLKAIEESKLSIVVFSKNYASSTSCLDELVKILECRKENDQMVVPVFYDVDLSELRHQRGCYGEALAKHQANFNDKKKLLKWRSALLEAANLSGWSFKSGYEYEAKLIHSIVEEVSSKINHSPFYVANYPVGLESRVQEINSLLDLGSADKVFMIGIWGMGGIGKTTLARSVYNHISGTFEGSCFLPSIRENSIRHGLVQLQEKLLSNILGERYIKLGDVNEGISILKSRLCRRKVLLVLDDIDNVEQLELTAGRCDWFGSGSRINMTTRDEHVLVSHGVERLYEVKGLNHQEALELICQSGFRVNKVDPSYKDVLSQAVFYAHGLPLALKLMGSNFYHKTADEWRSLLGKYERIPENSDKRVREILRVIFEDLDKAEKEVFMDIACFFKGYALECAEKILKQTLGFGPDVVIRGLIDRSLIQIECGVMQMHDLILDFAREISRQQSMSGPFKRRRLWSFEDVFHVLKEHKETGNFEVISMKGLKKLRNIRIPKKKTAYFSMDFDHLPNSLRYPCTGNIRMLSLVRSCRIIDKQLKKFEFLSHMDFKSCKFLSQLPDLSGVPNITNLRLDHCKNLVKVHDSIGFLDKLRILSIKGCAKLNTFIHYMKLTSLEYLYLSHCSNLQRSEFKFVSMCKGQELGSSISSSNVTHLDLRACNLSDQFLLVCLSCFPYVRYLNLMENKFTVLPACIKECRYLRLLYLDDCKELREIRGIPANIKLFSAINCTSLTTLSTITLLSQALHESQNTQFILPGGRIPEWFDRCYQGGSVSFWVRKKFPAISLCFALAILDKKLRKFKLKLHMVINGNYQFDFNCTYFLMLETDHLVLFDLQRQMPYNEVEVDKILIDCAWNHVQISCVSDPNMKGNALENEVIRWSGVYVYKQQSGMEDIRFTDPTPRKRKNNFFDSHDDLEQSCYLFLKKQHTFLNLRDFETLDIHQKQNLGSITQYVPTTSEPVYEYRDNYTLVSSDARVKPDRDWLSLLPSLQPLNGVNIDSNSMLSRKIDGVSSDKGAKMSQVCKICKGTHLGKGKQKTNQPKIETQQCDQSKQVQVGIDTQDPEIRDNQGSVDKEADGGLISMELCTDCVGSSLNDATVEATNASFESEATSLVGFIDTETNTATVITKLSEETKKALQILREFVSSKFSLLMQPGRLRFMKIILDYLLSLSADDGISSVMKSVILQLSRSFTLWSRDYDDASIKHWSTTAYLSKVNKLEVEIEANIKEFRELDSFEEELCSQLARLQEKKRVLEEHLNAITDEIVDFKERDRTTYECHHR